MDLLKSLYPLVVAMGIVYVLGWIRRRGDRGRRIADSLTVTLIAAAVIVLAITGPPYTSWILLATGAAMIVAAVLHRLGRPGDARNDPSRENTSSDALGS